MAGEGGSYHIAKTVPFDKVRKYYKQFKGMTFNDFMMGVLSKSYHQWFEHYEIKDAKDMFMIIPVNLRNLPSGYHNLQVDCGIVGSKFMIPLKDSVEEGMKAIKPTLQRFVTDDIIIASRNLCWLVPYLPEFLGRILFTKCTEKSDVSFSNVPFHKKSWRLSKKEIKNITFFNNIQVGLNVNTLAITYKGQVQVMVIGKKGMKMDPQIYTDLIYKNMMEEIEKLPKEN